ncbi:MAG: Chromate resistance protein ChrB [Pseudonocardiaceae bacterium]
MNNPVLRTEGGVTLVDGVLTVAVLVGLSLNAGLGWWWADPVAGYVLVYYAVREVREIFGGKHQSWAAAGHQVAARSCPDPLLRGHRGRCAGSLPGIAVTRATLFRVIGSISRWLVVVVRVPAAPSRHRVAVWRELRRIGALSLGQGTWGVPDVPGFADGITRVIELAERGEGEVVVLEATGRGETDSARLRALFTAERQDEWTEFVADCGKFDAEIDKEISKGKFTMAELEEEEQSLERLRRWHRDLKVRDVFGAPSAAEAEQRLKHCTERLADYTERVFAALHQM